jgi:elongation factor Ts
VEEVAAVKVDPKLVKELRNSSGAGMMDCKKALMASNNDLEAAAVRLCSTTC